jgi:pyrroloquinoline quinone biosynthesis protein E
MAGCRCQAFALTGDATNPDPVCTLTPLRSIIEEALVSADGDQEYIYRYVDRGAVEEATAGS